MDEIINVKRSDGSFSRIILGNTEKHLETLLKGQRVIAITDTNVYKHYKHIIDTYEDIIIGLGEENKTLSSVSDIYDSLVALGADRKCYILGFGGGIVTDIAGFAASTYMRGIRFGFVASTLLAQVDASVGGKNGVNFEGYKNMVGTFNQPDFVICDTDLLKTLPEREIHAGLAEIIKAGLICDAGLFHLFETHSFSDFYQDKTLLNTVIKASIQIKAGVVEQDEREAGERRKLNLGHTFAHAIEKSSHAYLHGEAVAIGLCIAARISEKLGKLTHEETERIKKAVERMGLPTETDIDTETLFNALKIDKKKENDSVNFVLMNGIGNCIVKKLSFDELSRLLNI